MLFDRIQAKKIAMFDFTKNHTFVDVADMTSQYVDTNITVSDLAAAVFEGDLAEELPDQVTICVTVFADMGFVTVPYKGWPTYPWRHLPTWAFMNDTGHLNLSLSLQMVTDMRKGFWEGNEKMSMQLNTGVKDSNFWPFHGKLLLAFFKTRILNF